MAKITFIVQGTSRAFTWSAKWKQVPSVGERVVISDYPSLHAVANEVLWSPSGKRVTVRLDARHMVDAELAEFERRWMEEIDRS